MNTQDEATPFILPALKRVPTAAGVAYCITATQDCIVGTRFENTGDTTLFEMTQGEQRVFVGTGDDIFITDKKAFVIPFPKAALPIGGGQGGSIGFTAEVVDELPTEGKRGVIYLVPSVNPAGNNVSDEYLWTQLDGAWSWEKIGSTDIDLSGYVQSADVAHTYDPESEEAISGKGVANAAFARLDQQNVYSGQLNYFGDAVYQNRASGVVVRAGECVMNFLAGSSTPARRGSAWFELGLVGGSFEKTIFFNNTNLDGRIKFSVGGSSNVCIECDNECATLKSVKSKGPAVFDSTADFFGDVSCSGELTKGGVDVATLEDIPDVSGIALPVGTLIHSAAQQVSGYLLCDGSAVSRTDYAALFAAIGSTYGDGDGETTFNVPDARGRVLWGANEAQPLGSVIEAGLPNITGSLGRLFGEPVTSGAFYTTYNGDPSVSGGQNHRETLAQIDASRSNPIYGASDTVQPPALAVNVFIKY